jgi:hypothetical protein
LRTPLLPSTLMKLEEESLYISSFETAIKQHNQSNNPDHDAPMEAVYASSSTGPSSVADVLAFIPVRLPDFGVSGVHVTQGRNLNLAEHLASRNKSFINTPSDAPLTDSTDLQAIEMATVRVPITRQAPNNGHWSYSSPSSRDYGGAMQYTLTELAEAVDKVKRDIRKRRLETGYQKIASKAMANSNSSSKQSYGNSPSKANSSSKAKHPPSNNNINSVPPQKVNDNPPAVEYDVNLEMSLRTAGEIDQCASMEGQEESLAHRIMGMVILMRRAALYKPVQLLDHLNVDDHGLMQSPADDHGLMGMQSQDLGYAQRQTDILMEPRGEILMGPRGESKGIFSEPTKKSKKQQQDQQKLIIEIDPKERNRIIEAEAKQIEMEGVVGSGVEEEGSPKKTKTEAQRQAKREKKKRKKQEKKEMENVGGNIEGNIEGTIEGDEVHEDNHNPELRQVLKDTEYHLETMRKTPEDGEMQNMQENPIRAGVEVQNMQRNTKESDTDLQNILCALDVDRDVLNLEQQNELQRILAEIDEQFRTLKLSEESSEQKSDGEQKSDERNGDDKSSNEKNSNENNSNKRSDSAHHSDPESNSDTERERQRDQEYSEYVRRMELQSTQELEKRRRRGRRKIKLLRPNVSEDWVKGIRKTLGGEKGDVHDEGADKADDMDGVERVAECVNTMELQPQEEGNHILMKEVEMKQTGTVHKMDDANTNLEKASMVAQESDQSAPMKPETRRMIEILEGHSSAKITRKATETSPQKNAATEASGQDSSPSKSEKYCKHNHWCRYKTAFLRGDKGAIDCWFEHFPLHLEYIKAKLKLASKRGITDLDKVVKLNIKEFQQKVRNAGQGKWKN